MKFGTSIMIFFLAIIALVAEFILYMIFGLGAAFSGDLSTLSGIAFFFVSLMVLTAATGVLAPICALVELIVKKKNVGEYTMVSILGLILVGLVVFSATGIKTVTETKVAPEAPKETLKTTPPPTTSPPVLKLEPLNIHAYYDGVMAWYIVGEIKNPNDLNYKIVEVTGTLYDAEGKVVDLTNTYVNIGSKETVPFKMMSLTKKQLDTYKVSVKTPMIGSPGRAFSSYFTIKNTNAEYDGVMATYITGEITNNANTAFSYLELSATLYNSEGTVIDVTNGYVEVGPGQTTAFKLMSLTKEKVSRYKVQVTGP